jgi:hypothetical protein
MRCLAFLAIALTVPLMAKDKKPKAPEKTPQDSIDVVAHFPATNGLVRRFLSTDHYSSHYLYVEHDGGAGVTLIDISNASRPTVLGEVAYPGGSAGNLVAVAGTAALATSADAVQAAAPQTLRIFDFSDPRNPKVAREFTGVTAIDRDDRRGLIFIANGEGIFILHQNRAQDPEVEKAYAHHVIYDH